MHGIRKHANLIYELARADFKLKYYGSFTGLLWSFLKPFFMLLILYGVFFHILKVDTPYYPWFLLLGIIVWNFFADTTKESMQSISAKAHILRNVNISPIIAVLSTFLHLLWTFTITLVVFGILLGIFRVPFSGNIFLILFLLLLLVLVTLGVSLLTAPLFTRFRDFGHLWDILLQMFFWILPITYSHSLVPESYRVWYLTNPLTRIIIYLRDTILYHNTPDASALLYTALSSFVLFAIGVLFFMRQQKALIEHL
ncbi:MAG: ABC transporter permease [Candidatus Paceibacterota bacterium]|jgi:ABC-type polysaccharide/polyol phosphate export permease